MQADHVVFVQRFSGSSEDTVFEKIIRIHFIPKTFFRAKNSLLKNHQDFEDRTPELPFTKVLFYYQ